MKPTADSPACWSALAQLLRDHLPEASVRGAYPLTGEAAARFSGHAGTAAYSLLDSLYIVGKLMVHADTRQLDAGDWNTLGGWLITASEAAQDLMDRALEASTAAGRGEGRT